MKVLVTGGAGYIGSVTVQQMLDMGYEVTVFDNLGRGHFEAIDRRATFIKGDLLNREQIRDVMVNDKPDAVMHFAAFALVGESMDKPGMYFNNNVVGGINLADAMIDSGVPKIIFSSTCATYGQPEKMPMTEDLPQKPTNPYGESKLMFEKVLLWHNRLHGIKSVFLRYFNACGATDKFGEDHDPETHLIPIVLQTALGKREKVLIFGADYDTPDGTCIRDYIHILDLAQAHILALDDKIQGAFNLGNGSGSSVKEVIEAARKVTGKKISAETTSRRPGDPARLIASSEKAKKVLGWSPRYADLGIIIEHTWSWMQKNPNGYAR